MGEQERPGEQEAYKWRGAVDDEPPKDEADSEGHAIRSWKVTGEPPEDDTEGHAIRGGWKASEEKDATAPDEIYRPGRATDDTEGHGIKFRVTDQPEPGTDEQDRVSDDDDTEGHGRGRA